MGYRVVLILHNIERREPCSWALTYECHVFRKNKCYLDQLLAGRIVPDASSHSFRNGH